MDRFELDRFKWRIWDKEKNEYVNQMDCSYWDLCFWFEPYNEDKKSVLMDIGKGGRYIPERHTGLYDTKNYDVYEGDIIKDNQGRIAIVRWSITWCEYELKWIKNNTGSSPEFWEWIFDKGCGTEVIGNIHENKDLLENK